MLDNAFNYSVTNAYFTYPRCKRGQVWGNIKLASWLSLSKLIKILKTRLLLTTGFLVLTLVSKGQMDNTWLLFTGYLPSLDHPDSTFALDFNTSPARYRKHFLKKDESLRYSKNNSWAKFGYFFSTSFCDSTGSIVFTQLMGQHYYNKQGYIYDSTYIYNNHYGYLSGLPWKMFVENDGLVYFFQTFIKIDKEPEWNTRQFFSDSVFICMSSFKPDGTLLIKNKIIYSFKVDKKNNEPYSNIYGRMFAKDTVELIVGLPVANGTTNNIRLLYNLKQNKIEFIPFHSTLADKPGWISYNTKKNKLIFSDASSAYLLEVRGRNAYQQLYEITPQNIPPPAGYSSLFNRLNFRFSPNDSVLYSIACFKNIENENLGVFLLALNPYNPFTGYRWIELKDPDIESPVGGNSLFFLKLGPDGCIYLSGDRRIVSKFRIIHPNSLKNFKLEKMPEIITLKDPLRPNYYLWISTLDDYKRVEFSAYPTCKGLKMGFYNRSDTQYFKRYRLFFTPGDSMELGPKWQKQLYTYKAPGKYYVRLKAFSKGGGFIWYGDSIEIHQPPVAKFGIQKTKGCQWIGYGFTDSSQLFGIKPGFKAYKRWFFGDGKDSINASTNPKLTYTYTTSNTFTVKLVVNNGYCTDTATQLNNVLILPAPKPGIIAAPVNGCTPLKVDFKYKYSDILDSAVWRSGSLEKSKGIIGNFTYTQTGYFFLSQKLYGPSGCITTDSVLIKVNPGISGMPDILNATVVNENSIDLKWKKHLNAVSYSIIKNNSFLTRTTDTSYTDKSANTLMPNSYTIKAISICNDSTKVQDLAQTIYLQAQRTDNNEAKLNWTAYQRWDAGVNTYQLFTQNEAGYFELMATLNGQTLEYLDESFAGISEPQKCYKIIADEKEGNLQQSASNIYCLPLKPVLLIPSAFSPNGDGVNDTWKISYKGIREANIKIFNRWGEVIYKYTAEKPEWDAIYKGLPVPVGTYFYQIEAIGIKEGKVYKNGLVEVVR